MAEWWRLWRVDDIRTLATSCDSLEKQASDFVEKNYLKLNRKKCEVVAFGKSNNSATSCMVDGCFMPVGDVGKCLGFWWKRDLFATKCVDENIRKARKAFLGMAALVLFKEVLVLSPQYQLLRPVYFLPYYMGPRIGF